MKDKTSLKRIQEYLKKNRYYIVSVAVVVILLVIFLGIKSQNREELDKFAQCLTTSGAKMYGAYWCSHCAEQKKMFANSFKYANYVECDPKGRNSQQYLCIEKGIKSYPTWEFEDGTLFLGVMTLDKLGEKTGCQAP